MSKVPAVRLQVTVAGDDIRPVTAQDPVDVHRLAAAVDTPIRSLKPDPVGVGPRCMSRYKFVLNTCSRCWERDARYEGSSADIVLQIWSSSWIPVAEFRCSAAYLQIKQ